MAASAPEAVAHHDAARSAVSSTALGVCAMRAIESAKPEGERLIHDRFAILLCGEAQLEMPWIKATGMSNDFWVDFLALRTRWIDDQISDPSPGQLVVLGAGLDSRSYRLSALSGASVYELDFPEVLGAKQKLLSGEQPLGKLQFVPANLGTDEWMKSLTAAGFECTSPSTWLLEGLTGYLTEEELMVLLKRVSEFAVEGSRMIVSFVGRNMQKQATDMHRYFVEDEDQIKTLLQSFGWQVGHALRLGAIAKLYGRTDNISQDYAYFLAAATHGSTQPDAKKARCT